MSFLEALVPFILFLALVAFYRNNGYYAEEIVSGGAQRCACNGVCVAPEVPVTSKELPPAVPATPARGGPPPTARHLSLAAASPSPRSSTPRVWRNVYNTDKESVDALLRWMGEKFLEEEEEEEEDL